MSAAFAPFDLVSHLAGQAEFSAATFGPGPRTRGVLDHIRKELAEIERQPDDLSEWIDVVILAFDGALRAGHAPDAVVAALVAKQRRNELRTWPDWRKADPDKAIEHVRGETQDEYAWYFAPGQDPEHFSPGGPTREATLEQAWTENPDGGFTLVEAAFQQPTFCHFEADDVLDRYQEHNEDCWGEDGPEISASPEQTDDLERSLAEAHRAWAERHDLKGRLYIFGGQRNREYVPPAVPAGSRSDNDGRPSIYDPADPKGAE